MAKAEYDNAVGLREMAALLTTLADDMDAGHAKWQGGGLAFRFTYAGMEAPSGVLMEWKPAKAIPGRLPQGSLKIEANIEFLTGQPAE